MQLATKLDEATNALKNAALNLDVYTLDAYAELNRRIGNFNRQQQQLTALEARIMREMNSAWKKLENARQRCA